MLFDYSAKHNLLQAKAALPIKAKPPFFAPYLLFALFRAHEHRRSNEHGSGKSAWSLSTGFRILFLVLFADSDMNYIVVIGKAGDYCAFLISASCAGTDLRSVRKSCGCLCNYPCAKLMGNNRACLSGGNKLFAGLAIGIAGISALGAGCLHIVLYLGFAGVVIRVLFGHNGLYFGLSVLV